MTAIDPLKFVVASEHGRIRAGGHDFSGCVDVGSPDSGILIVLETPKFEA